MRAAILTGGAALFLVFTCAGFAPQDTPSLTPLPPARADVKILPGPLAPGNPATTHRFPMVIVQADPAQFPMPVTRGRVGNYPIRVIPPSDLDYEAMASPTLLRPTYANPLPVYPKVPARKK
jgi:hypothetical protein